MKEYIEAIKGGNLVEAKKQFGIVMEGRKEILRQEMRVQIAEAIRAEGEEDNDDDEDKEDKGDTGKDKDGKKPNPFDKKDKEEGDDKPEEKE